MPNKTRWVLVTGASSGIGQATALSLLDEGYSIIACSRNEEDLKNIYSSYSTEQVLISPCDLTAIDGIEAYAKNINQAVEEIYALVHCAGIQQTLSLPMASNKKVEQLFKLNTFAAIELIRVFSKAGMYCKDAASFVLISSQAAHEGAVGNSIYAASKGALEGFLAPAASELSRRNIRLNIVIPGFVESRMTQSFVEKLSDEQRANLEKQFPLGIGQPEHIAESIKFLISEQSNWTTGQTFTIDGGHAIAFKG